MIKVGDKLPDVQFNVPTSEGMKQMRTAEIFGGKTVALFAVPGAFTPTCSARHLPSFRDKVADLKAKASTLIACTAVNDHFVMGAWAKDQGVVRGHRHARRRLRRFRARPSGSTLTSPSSAWGRVRSAIQCSSRMGW